MFSIPLLLGLLTFDLTFSSCSMLNKRHCLQRLSHFFATAFTQELQNLRRASSTLCLPQSAPSQAAHVLPEALAASSLPLPKRETCRFSSASKTSWASCKYTAKDTLCCCCLQRPSACALLFENVVCQELSHSPMSCLNIALKPGDLLGVRTRAPIIIWTRIHPVSGVSLQSISSVSKAGSAKAYGWRKP